MNTKSNTPVEGRTFSLFGGTDSTDGYFRTVDTLLLSLLDGRTEDELLRALRGAAKRPSHFSRRARRTAGMPLHPDENARIHETLSPYTSAANAHLRQLPLLKRRDHTLAMPRGNYHFAMLETALVNRMQREKFSRSGYRIALLPHCLRDLTRDCRAERDGLDLRCRKCSPNCFIRRVSTLLEEHGIEPYIWMSLGRRELFRTLRRKADTPGVLGIACIPELLTGMRMCLRENVAVVGLPLNANRCARWMGAFHPNSIAIQELENLLRDPRGAASL